jgi:5-methyltetrahydrofolate--homocysteine methyltransferase
MEAWAQSWKDVEWSCATWRGVPPEAGAEMIITNTFSTNRNMLDEIGLGDQVHQVNTLAVEVASDARVQAAGDQVLIAGSISSMPPGTSREKLPAGEQVRANYREQAHILAEAGVDLIVLEMMRDLEHTGYALDAALSTGLPVWVGFSCKMSDDGSTVLLLGFRGYPDILLSQGLELLSGKEVELVAIMHTLVEDTTPALREVLRSWRGPVGTYPHSGSFIMPNW